jgi:quercetin dioxygenase-like cupin family protein
VNDRAYILDNISAKINRLTLQDIRSLVAICCVVLASTPQAAEDKTVIVTPVISTSVTVSGQPIILPQEQAQVSVAMYEIARGAVLPEHKHPFPRYGYLLAGSLRVTNTETGKSEDYKPGNFILESVGQWHRGANVGDEPIKLLVIDFVKRGESNVIAKK